MLSLFQNDARKTYSRLNKPNLFLFFFSPSGNREYFCSFVSHYKLIASIPLAIKKKHDLKILKSLLLAPSIPFLNVTWPTNDISLVFFFSVKNYLIIKPRKHRCEEIRFKLNIIFFHGVFSMLYYCKE